MNRPQLTARLRLTLLYSCLFVAFGAALLTLNYRLLAQQLPSGGGSTTASVSVGPDGSSGAEVTTTPTPVEGSGMADADGTVTVVTAVAEFRDRTFDQLLRNSVLTLLVGAALAALVVWLTAGRVLQPLHRITDTARRVSDRNLSERIPLSGPRDELFDLADTFNATLDRLEAAFAHERRLVANTSHELRTPVANQKVLLEVTLADPQATAQQLREACQTALAQTQRTEDIIEAMLTLSRIQRTPQDRQSVRLDQVVGLVLDDHATAEPSIESDLQPVTIDADELYCRLAVTNLVANAMRHNVEGGWVEISVRQAPGGVELVVTNSAPDVSAEQVDELRESFRRAGTARTRSTQGNGLGLAIVDTIAAVHGWTLTLAANAPDTFEARIFVPTAADLTLAKRSNS